MRTILVYYLVLLAVIPVSNAQNLTVSISNYEGGNVSVQIFGENISISKTFQNASITLPVEPGNYHVVVTYKNLTLIRNANVTNDTYLNLSFEESSDPSVLLYLNRHIIMGRGEVLEVDIILNPTEKFFRGSFEKILPENARNLTILEFTGSLQNFSVLDGKIVYENVVIPPNSSIRAVYHYFLDSDSITIYSEFKTNQIVLFLPPDVSAESNKLSYVGTHNFGGSAYNIYTASDIEKGEKINVKFEKIKIERREKSISLNPFLLAGIALILAGVGLYFYSRKKEGKEEKEDWKI